MFFREAASVLEERDGWARITKYYDASCVNGFSEYVDSGNKQCTEENGVQNGELAEWVSAKYLSADRPADPALRADGYERVVAQSDDYRLYKDAFVNAARQLIDDKTCTAGDFADNGGWVKSTTTYRDKPVYFTYCGGATIANRLYLDVSTGRIFR